LSHDAGFNNTDAQPLDFIAPAESVIREAPITEESRNLLRQRISSGLISHKKRKTLSKAEIEAHRTLKADKNIVILAADKGRSTVILNKENYANKFEALLGDRTAYIPREDDMTKTLGPAKSSDIKSNNAD
uniref:Flagellar motor protein MotB n=1 Tax=Schistocephalus solidus TaxID=70667 RepID=A0A183T896_SCHSO